jgi:peptidoglycan/xylan/chitin deacetylase (PgdA/CDA1 family)
MLAVCSCTIFNVRQNKAVMILNHRDEANEKGIITPSLEITYYPEIVPTIQVEHPAPIAPDNRMARQGPGNVDIPILLYHHISIGAPANSYTVSQAVFRDQMDYLSKNGFNTISMDDLVRSIEFGADLPSKPVMITFDDGNENVYLNAFPIMQEKDFFGIVMIIANRIGADGFLSDEQLLILNQHGWEIGSHGTRHIDLVKEPQALRDEIANSKRIIEKKLNLPVTIFAYPYGKASPQAMDWVKRIGYLSALGLGINNDHSSEDLFYLQRREVKKEFDLVEFSRLLEAK